MGISSDAQWMKFCNAFNCPAEWTEDEKYCSNLVRGYHYFGDLRVKLEDLFSNYTMQEIADICDQALIPVSYTHLDVYKRQGRCRGCF